MTYDWLQTPLGEALLRQEARVVEEALDGIFGEDCLQLGMWGDRHTFTRFTRTQHCSSHASRSACRRAFSPGTEPSKATRIF